MQRIGSYSDTHFLHLMRVFTILALLAFVSCRPSTAPLPSGDGPAVTPADGSQYIYQYSSTDSAGNPLALHETVTIQTGATGFVAASVSDTVRGFNTTSSESYTARTDGDLQCNCGCNNYIYPIQTQRTYLVGGGSIQTPTKKNGVAFDANVRIELSYLGAENVTAAGQTFNCAKVQRHSTIKPVDPIPGVATQEAITIFWYSSKLGYFVKEQNTVTPGSPWQNYSRILTGHR